MYYACLIIIILAVLFVWRYDVVQLKAKTTRLQRRIDLKEETHYFKKDKVTIDGGVHWYKVEKSEGGWLILNKVK